MIEIQNLSFQYGKRSAKVLKNVNLQLGDGEIGILLGKNGSGKTTLFKNILSINKPCSGNIFFDGKDFTKMSRIERARRIAYVPQHIHFGSLTVYDSVLLGRVSYFGTRAGAEDHRVVERILSEMGLESYSMRIAEELSGGEQQKVAIARAMAQEPRLMVFDEPTGNLDIANEQLIIEEAKKLSREKGISILSSLHDLNQALDFGDKFFFMKDGEIKYAGDQEILCPDVIKDIFGIDVRVIEIDNKKIIIGGKQNEN